MDDNVNMLRKINGLIIANIIFIMFICLTLDFTIRLLAGISCIVVDLIYVYDMRKIKGKMS